MVDQVAEQADDPRKGRLLHVTRAQFLGSLAGSLLIFFFVTGPLWRHAADISRLDHAIYWSYAAIPFLIAACLVGSKRWSVRGFLLDTLALGVTKYVVTASIAIVFWAIGGDPQRVASTLPRAAIAAPKVGEPLPAPTPIDPATTGEVQVTVRDGAGGPVEGAVVYVAKGLEGFVFAPPADALVLSNDGKGVSPSFAVAQVGQAIEGRSRDGRLHTLVVRRDGAALFNVPLLSSGDPTIVRASDTAGVATVRCNVHGVAEPESKLVLVPNPFHAITDASGHAVLPGVPAAAVEVVARDAAGREAHESVTVTAHGSAAAKLRF